MGKTEIDKGAQKKIHIYDGENRKNWSGAFVIDAKESIFSVRITVERAKFKRENVKKNEYGRRERASPTSLPASQSASQLE